MYFQRKFVGVACVAAALCVSRIETASAQDKLLLGINYNYTQLDKTREANCGPGNQNAPARGYAFLSHYQDPSVRGKVRAALAQMREAGFEAIRTLIFFGPKGHIGPDAFSEEDPNTAALNLRNFAHDVHEAGFSRLYLSFGPLGRSSVSCRKFNYGDCFDQAYKAKNIDFILGVRRGIAAQDASFLYIDLQNEGGLTQFHPVNMRRNMESYLAELIGAYTRSFPTDRITVSVQDKFMDERLHFVAQTFHEASRDPSYWEFHLYHADETRFSTIRSTLKSLREDQLEVSVGETLYESPSDIHLLANFLQNQSYAPILLWPLTKTLTNCGINAPPPYDLRWMTK
ncbi:hypothetical protein [Acidisoma sp. 7E03]